MAAITAGEGVEFGKEGGGRARGEEVREEVTTAGERGGKGHGADGGAVDGWLDQGRRAPPGQGHNFINESLKLRPAAG